MSRQAALVVDDEPDIRELLTLTLTRLGLLVDTAGGPSTLRVAEGSTRTAADLHLLGDAQTIDIGGT